MRKEDYLRELARKISRLGWPGKHVSRIVQETSDHWDDLEAESRERGLGDSAAAAFASERIGEPGVLVRLHQDRMRQAHWSSRHPVISFALMPPVLLGLWFMVWTAMAMGAGALYSELLALPHMVWRSYLLVFIWATVIHYTGVVAIPAIACWWARRSFCGTKWGWIACGVCAVHGLLNHVTVRPNSLHWGYGLATPDWLSVIAPLIVAAMAHWWGRQTLRRVGVPLLVAVFATGCTSSKVPQERGWIGGEYKKAGRSERGMLITRLSTNTPAARSGLREGDLILRLDGERVKHPKAFHKAINLTSPGEHIALEISREGAQSKHEVTVGKEVVQPTRNITVGLLLSREWDLWPNPGFSLVALGYKRDNTRIELDSPESRFDLASRNASNFDEQDSKGLRSREGWEVWLPVCSFSSRKRVLAQTMAE